MSDLERLSGFWLITDSLKDATRAGDVPSCSSDV